MESSKEFVESDLENEDEESIMRLCNSTVWDDLIVAIYDVRFAAPIVLLFALILSYHITIAPYRAHVEDHSNFIPRADLDLVLVCMYFFNYIHNFLSLSRTRSGLLFLKIKCLICEKHYCMQVI
jgi:hypothetical protein